MADQGFSLNSIWRRERERERGKRKNKKAEEKRRRRKKCQAVCSHLSQLESGGGEGGREGGRKKNIEAEDKELAGAREKDLKKGEHKGGRGEEEVESRYAAEKKNNPKGFLSAFEAAGTASTFTGISPPVNDRCGGRRLILGALGGAEAAGGGLIRFIRQR